MQVDQNSRIAELEQGLSSVQAELKALLQSYHELRPVPEWVPSVDLFDAVLKLTEQLFRSKVFMEKATDPDDPDDSFMIVHATTGASPDEALELQCQWHERMNRIMPDHHERLRLSIGFAE